MSYLDLFQRYGRPSREAEIRLTAYLLRPDALTADRIKAHDDSAARMIARCNELIDQLTEYRAALAERYAALATAAYRDRLELTRDPGYRGKGGDLLCADRPHLRGRHHGARFGREIFRYGAPEGLRPVRRAEAPAPRH